MLPCWHLETDIRNSHSTLNVVLTAVVKTLERTAGKNWHQKQLSGPKIAKERVPIFYTFHTPTFMTRHHSRGPQDKSINYRSLTSQWYQRTHYLNFGTSGKNAPNLMQGTQKDFVLFFCPKFCLCFINLIFFIRFRVQTLNVCNTFHNLVLLNSTN